MNSENTIVYIKVAGPRPDSFQDPQKFSWDIEKDRKLWSQISRLADNRKAIDWHNLSKDLDAPELFLRKRSYRLFSQHLKILEEHMESRSAQFVASRELHPDSDKSCELSTSTELKDDDIKHIIPSRTLQNLRSSKIMNQQISVPDRTADSSLSELSNLSVSKSALEEALMDRLQL